MEQRGMMGKVLIKKNVYKNNNLYGKLTEIWWPRDANSYPNG
jgi:hypothetical protein